MTTNTRPDGKRGQPGRTYHVTLWVAQCLIAAVFLTVGYMKSTMPLDELAKIVPWAKDYRELFVRTIGAIDLAGGIGMLLPAWTRILPGLGVLAALGCTTILTLAVGFHFMRGEGIGIAVNCPLAIVAAFVLWGRWKRDPIQPRRSGSSMR